MRETFYQTDAQGNMADTAYDFAKEEVTEEEDFVILSNIEVEEILREIYKEEKSNEKK